MLSVCIGLLLNGFVIFKAEKRYVKSKNDYFEIRHKYMNFESTMTLNDFENELKDSYQSALKDASCENVLEALSGIAFIIGVILAISSMLISII